MSLEVITILIAVLAFLVAFAGYLFSRRVHNEEQANEQGRLSTKLDLIGDDVKDIKTEVRVTREELKEVRDIAVNAQHTADTALDMIERHTQQS